MKTSDRTATAIWLRKLLKDTHQRVTALAELARVSTASVYNALSGTNKIADPKHFVRQANSFNRGLKTVLLTGVNPVTDKADVTGFIGALWVYQSNA